MLRRKQKGERIKIDEGYSFRQHGQSLSVWGTFDHSRVRGPHLVGRFWTEIQSLKGFFFFFFLSYFEREREQEHASGVGQRERRAREPEAGSTLSVQSLVQGLNSWTVRSWLDPRSEVECLTYWATQAPLGSECCWWTVRVTGSQTSICMHLV